MENDDFRDEIDSRIRKQMIMDVSVKLTERERFVLKLFLEDRSNVEIATAIKRSRERIRTYMLKIQRKLRNKIPTNELPFAANKHKKYVRDMYEWRKLKPVDSFVKWNDYWEWERSRPKAYWVIEED